MGGGVTMTIVISYGKGNDKRTYHHELTGNEAECHRFVSKLVQILNGRDAQEGVTIRRVLSFTRGE